MRASIHFDGACNNSYAHNTKKENPTGIGVAVFIDDEYSEEFSKGEAGPLGTSNIAEWHGCVRAMETALELRDLAKQLNEPLHIRIFSDSQIVTNQFNEKFQIKEMLFLNYYRMAKDFARRAGIAGGITWIPREKNGKADDLSKKGLFQAKIEYNNLEPAA